MIEKIKPWTDRFKEKDSIALSVDEVAKQLVDAFYQGKESSINHNINCLLDESFYTKESVRIAFADVVYGISLGLDCNSITAPYIYSVNDVMKDNQSFFSYIVIPYGDGTLNGLKKHNPFLYKNQFLYKLRKQFKISLMDKIKQILINSFYTVDELRMIDGEPRVDVFYTDNV